MPAVTRLGDVCSGDGCFGPRVNDEASTDVLVNKKGVHREGDHWVSHCCGPVCHDGVLEKGSSTVFVNKKPAARIGDPITCGAVSAQGSPSVFFG